MSDAFWAAREGDALMHTSMMADIVGGVLEVAANVAIGALATAAVGAALGITVATGGLGCFVLGAAVGLVVGVAMAKSGADTGLSRLCDGIGNALFPPSVQAHIATGSGNTHTNGKPAARAAGIVTGPVGPAADASGQPAGEEPEESFLDMAKGFFSQMWRPTVATPAPNTQEAEDDKILCDKHPAMPPQYLAEGSSKVLINGHPACRSGDRSTCEAVVVDAGEISSNVRIGGEPIVVREIRSGKTPGIGLAITALMLLRGRGGKFYSKFGCMLIGGVTQLVTSQVTSALTSAIVGSPNPVHTPTGAKLLNGEDDHDFDLPALLPITWQRYYNSHGQREDGLLGTGWSVPYEVYLELKTHTQGGEELVFVDEQARAIEMGSIVPGDAVYSAAEGLSVRRDHNGEVLIEDRDGRYRLFQPSPTNPTRLRLSQIGDRNDNRLFLDYDDSGRLRGLRDTFDQTEALLSYDPQWPQRVSQIERRLADASVEPLVSYGYDGAGRLAQVKNRHGQVTRRFSYDTGGRMVEHQLPTGLSCYYQWAQTADGWRVIRHWTDAGDEYSFEYDLTAGITRVTDGLQRVTTRHWNDQYQITAYTDALGRTWRFDWNADRQLLGASDPDGGRWSFNYDESGNLSETFDPLGRCVSTQWLEHWALPRSRMDAAGHCWRYHYDARGNCIRETDPLGQTTHYRYDPHGQVIEITDAAGRAKQLQWTDFGALRALTDCSGYTTRLDYDHRGHLAALIDAHGERTDYQHDASGRLVQVRLPDGRTQSFDYAVGDRLARHIDTAGHQRQFQYDARGQLRQLVDPLGRTVEYRYDLYGRLLSLTNENGEQYRFTWDAADRLVEQRDLDDSAKRYHYDALDCLSRLDYLPGPHGTGLALVPPTPAAVISHFFERDAGCRLLAKVTDDGRTEYQYDALDQLLQACFTDNQGKRETVAFAFDALGQRTQEQGSNGTLHHRHDALGNRLQTLLPDGRTLNQLYYGSGHLHQVNLDGKVICDFERDRLHREVLRIQGGFETRSEYDRAGRLRSRLSHPRTVPRRLPAPLQQRFEYDLADNLAVRFRQSPAGIVQQHLQHDANERIVSSSQPHAALPDEVFAYDAAANLLDTPSLGWVRHNRVLTYQDKRYRYDAFGRLVEKRSARRGVQRFLYDAEHRLIEVRSRNNGRERIVRMAYDPLGRRIEKSEFDETGRQLGLSRFGWDGYRLLEEVRHGQHSLYLYDDQDSHEPLARVEGVGAHQRVHHYQNDLNGLPERLSDDTGQLLWQAQYQVWGNTVQEVRQDGLVQEQNLRMQGQYLDRETGLHYNTFRYYDPDIGRFTQPDPIGLAGGLNLYQYAPTPATWIDPLGLEVCRLNKKNMAKLDAKKPTNMVRPHRHHIVREYAPRNWKQENRDYILNAQAIMKKHKIDLNTDLRNFTWAENGRGTHSVASARKVYERLREADGGGRKAVIKELAELGKEFTAGDFSK